MKAPKPPKMAAPKSDLEASISILVEWLREKHPAGSRGACFAIMERPEEAVKQMAILTMITNSAIAKAKASAKGASK